MSFGTLLHATRAHLQTELSFDTVCLAVTDRPPQGPLPLAVALADGGLKLVGKSQLIREYRLDVSLWLNVGGIIADRLPDKLAEAANETTLDLRQAEIIAALHAHAGLLTAANTLAGSRGIAPFKSPLLLQEVSPVEAIEVGGPAAPQSWLRRKLRFAGMRQLE